MPLNDLKGLYIVATPIGNYDDITLRALDTLKNSDLIICEDTRITSRLLHHFGIKKQLVIYNDFSDTKTRQFITEKLLNNLQLSLVSDAGTPLISDPGYKLVKEITNKGIKCFTIPGPSAVISALTIAQQPTDRFFFIGFVTSKKLARLREFKDLKAIKATLVFFESPRRLVSSLRDMSLAFGNRQATVVRELTKIYEEIKIDSLINLANFYEKEGTAKGEITIIVAPSESNQQIDQNLLIKDISEALGNFTLRDAVEIITNKYEQPKRSIYQLALSIKKNSQ